MQKATKKRLNCGLRRTEIASSQSLLAMTDGGGQSLLALMYEGRRIYEDV
jgi:hypothetical protein